MILTGHSCQLETAHDQNPFKTNGQSHLLPLRKRDEPPSDITAAEQRGEGQSQF
jgi:hypothetical protein